MGGEPGDHRKAEPVHVIGELVQIGTIDAGIDQDQPTLPAHHDGVAPDPLALPDPDAVGHLDSASIDPVRYLHPAQSRPARARTHLPPSAVVPLRARPRRASMVAVPEFLTPDRFDLELVDGDPTVTLHDAHVSSSEGWSFLNRLTVLVIDGPGEEGFLLPRHVDTAGDQAPQVGTRRSSARASLRSVRRALSSSPGWSAEGRASRTGHGHAGSSRRRTGGQVSHLSTTSLPGPPLPSSCRPRPPSRRSAPACPKSLSLPPPPSMRSSRPFPWSWSSPASPIIRSSPPSPAAGRSPCPCTRDRRHRRRRWHRRRLGSRSRRCPWCP